MGLTGGIGAGKSSVARLLVERGAHLVDGDAVARVVVAPGGAAYDELRRRFGPGLFHADGTLNRPAMAALVFADENARKALEAITHPAIRAQMHAETETHRGSDDVVIQDIPLLAEGCKSHYCLDGVIVVDCPVEVAVARLVEHRGLSASDAMARIAAQVSRGERIALADVVIENSGTLAALVPQVDAAWAWARSLHGRS